MTQAEDMCLTYVIIVLVTLQLEHNTLVDKEPLID